MALEAARSQLLVSQLRNQDGIAAPTRTGRSWWRR
jgi:hypothetical protein